MNNRDRAPGFGQRHFVEVIFPNFTQLLRWLKPAKSGRSMWYCGAVLLGATLVGAHGDADTTDPELSRSGFGKRYLRINEYLFNGTQKVTAIAWQTIESGNRLT